MCQTILDWQRRKNKTGYEKTKAYISICLRRYLFELVPFFSVRSVRCRTILLPNAVPHDLIFYRFSVLMFTFIYADFPISAKQ